MKLQRYTFSRDFCKYFDTFSRDFLKTRHFFKGVFDNPEHFFKGVLQKSEHLLLQFALTALIGRPQSRELKWLVLEPAELKSKYHAISE